MPAEGKVAQQIGPVGFYARVWVECALREGNPSRPVRVVDEQAEVAWKSAAAAGATWALEIAGVRASCAVTRIHGMPCDTNPTLVAIAAARAVWTALQFIPDEAVAARVEESILASHRMAEGRLGLPVEAVTDE